MSIIEKCLKLREIFPEYKDNQYYKNQLDYYQNDIKDLNAAEKFAKLSTIMQVSNNHQDALSMLAAYELYNDLDITLMR